MFPGTEQPFAGLLLGGAPRGACVCQIPGILIAFGFHGGRRPTCDGDSPVLAAGRKTRFAPVTASTQQLQQLMLNSGKSAQLLRGLAFFI